MCGTCGCGSGAKVTVGGAEHDPAHHDHGPHDHGHAHPHGHAHDHDGEHAHEHEHVDDHGHRYRHTHGHAGDHAHDERARVVLVERALLEKNDRIAARNRARLEAAHALGLNLVSSPGAGKTTLLVRTLTDLRDRVPMAVIEGDQQTSLDADRIRATGAPALQINTGALCHLDAAMIEDALGRAGVPERGVLFVENVGNLVCPAGFDLGEAGKVVLASVTEGEDKPLKYAPMFHAARLVLVTKIDLVPHLDCDEAALLANIARVNASADVIRVSARTGEGLDAWYAWIDARRRELGGA